MSKLFANLIVHLASLLILTTIISIILLGNIYEKMVPQVMEEE